jgi:PAS domain S-box-containing protein
MINIDDIFADCFYDGDAELIAMANQMGGIGPAGGVGAGAGLDLSLGLVANHSMPFSQEVMPAPLSYQAGSTTGVRPTATTTPSNSAKKEDDGKQRKRPRSGGRSMTDQQKLERRERNREHAKRSRVRKKFLLESLQRSVTALQDENDKLRGAIRESLGSEAEQLLAVQENDTSGLFATQPGDESKVLDDPDFSLIKALQTAKQNFVITDPTLPDNPIVFASQGFLDLTGYSMDQVLGRNCRFLQGPDSDPKAVEKIRKAIDQGVDASVCLLNYRKDGSTFYNSFFIAALRDADGKCINYVGVQMECSEEVRIRGAWLVELERTAMADACLRITLPRMPQFARAMIQREEEEEDGQSVDPLDVSVHSSSLPCWS